MPHKQTNILSKVFYFLCNEITLYIYLCGFQSTPEVEVMYNVLANKMPTNIRCLLQLNWAIFQMIRVLAIGSGDQGSIPGRVIPKTQKMVPDAALLRTQHYKVRIKGKVEQSRERRSALPHNSV